MLLINKVQCFALNKTNGGQALHFCFPDQISPVWWFIVLVQ